MHEFDVTVNISTLMHLAWTSVALAGSYTKQLHCFNLQTEPNDSFKKKKYKLYSRVTKDEISVFRIGDCTPFEVVFYIFGLLLITRVGST